MDVVSCKHQCFIQHCTFSQWWFPQGSSLQHSCTNTTAQAYTSYHNKGNMGHRDQCSILYLTLGSTPLIHTVHAVCKATGGHTIPVSTATLVLHRDSHEPPSHIGTTGTQPGHKHCSHLQDIGRTREREKGGGGEGHNLMYEEKNQYMNTVCLSVMLSLW